MTLIVMELIRENEILTELCVKNGRCMTGDIYNEKKKEKRDVRHK